MKTESWLLYKNVFSFKHSSRILSLWFGDLFHDNRIRVVIKNISLWNNAHAFQCFNTKTILSILNAFQCRAYFSVEQSLNTQIYTQKPYYDNRTHIVKDHIFL